MGIYEHAIKLEDNTQLYYMLIYSLRLIKFKIIKTCIKTHLANNFILLSKFLIDVFI